MSPHTAFPLRRIVRRERQNKKDVVVLACQHAAIGKPLSRYSRFFPCSICHQHVQKIRKEQQP
jgi:hypothetical protein